MSLSVIMRLAECRLRASIGALPALASWAQAGLLSQGDCVWGQWSGQEGAKPCPKAVGGGSPRGSLHVCS